MHTYQLVHQQLRRSNGRVVDQRRRTQVDGELVLWVMGGSLQFEVVRSLAKNVIVQKIFKFNELALCDPLT